MKLWWIQASRKRHKRLIKLFENGGLEVSYLFQSISHMECWLHLLIISWCTDTEHTAHFIMYALHEVPHERVLSQHTERSPPTEFDLIGTILKWRHNLTPGRVKWEGKGANKVSSDSQASCFMLRETLYLTWWVEQRPKQKSQERARPAQPHVLWKWFSRSLKNKTQKI